MKRINLLLTILFCAFYFNVNAQENEDNQRNVAELKIRDARLNGDNITRSVLSEKNSYVFYKASDRDDTLLSLVSDLNDDQTYGNIYLVSKEIDSSNKKRIEKRVYNFYWSYANSFDDYKGTYNCSLSLLKKKKAIYYELRLKQENLDEFLFRGEFKGNISFLEEQIGK
jgi:hypothetical protein